MKVLEATNLTYIFPDGVKILENIELELYEAEFVSILGLSGSGKSTLFNLLAGLDQAQAGTIKVHGKSAYMLQKDLLLPWKKLIDNVSLPLVLQGKSKKQARAYASKYLAQFGLAGLDMRYPQDLSGGQRQRAALLRTYLAGGNILLLDEPFASLDALSRSELGQWLKQLAQELKLSILLITHDIREALALSDRLYLLSATTPATLSPSIKVDPTRKEEQFTEVYQQLLASQEQSLANLSFH